MKPQKCMHFPRHDSKQRGGGINNNSPPRHDRGVEDMRKTHCQMTQEVECIDTHLRGKEVNTPQCP